MDGEKLPTFNQIIGPAYRTIFRGVKIAEDIHLNHVFRNCRIDEGELRRFRNFFNYKRELPMTFLYTLAQRAQSYLMLKKEFTIAIPGLIHVENYIEQKGEVDRNQTLEIEVEANVEKKEGSLLPEFEVHFRQSGEDVAYCKSTYLAKRKSKKSRSRRQNPREIEAEKIELWSIYKRLGKHYGEIAGDRNPIHTSWLFARLAGFKRPIAQGWYLVSRANVEIENKLDIVMNSIEVSFHKPIFLGSDVHFRYNFEEFRIRTNGDILTSGKFKSADNIT